jgi:hypothetical protein
VAYLDYTDLKRRLKQRLGRPSTDEAFTVDATDDVYDDKLTEAQDRVNKLLAIHSPDAVWTVPTALTSDDGGVTYGFGTDTDSAAIFAFGHFEVYEKRIDYPDLPLTEGVDFVVQGTKLRMPGAVPRTFADSGPWALYVAPSNIVSAVHQPVIPVIARHAMLTDAEIRCWEHLGLDSSGAEAAFENKDWPELLAVLRTQSLKKGSQPLLRRPRSYLLRGRGR